MQEYKTYFRDKAFLFSLFTGVLFLATSLVAQFLASNYATLRASFSVTDIILSNTKVYDVDMIFVYGAIALFLITLFVILKHPNRLPFVIKSVATFTLIRAFFISLTHIGPFPERIAIDSIFYTQKIFNGIFTGDGLFFSGHTGVPFLLALIFWEYRTLRFIFLGFSVIFGVSVLLGHIHYTIDVVSAYFITYSIFIICKRGLKKDWALFLQKTS